MPDANSSDHPMQQCPVCEAPASFALEKEGCAYHLCGSCEFLFHRPELKGEEPSTLHFYDERYWEMERAEALRREQEDSFIRALELIYISSIRVENVLDFGCGLGLTVELLRQKLGLNAIGVDLSAQFAETEYLHRCDLEALHSRYPAGYFDAIYSIEVFEHLVDPGKVLSMLKDLLKPGGKILINTSTREFIARYDPDQTYIDPVRRGHISIYSLKSFARLAGFFGYSAQFLGDHSYAVVLAPQDAAGYPVAENLERTRALGEWYPALLREYMRLLFVEKESEEKGAWIVQLLKEADSLRVERSGLVEELRRLRDSRVFRLISLWRRLTT